MKKFKKLLAVICLLAICLSMTAVAFADDSSADVVPGAVVAENPEAKTGYTATFTYVDEYATNVQIIGSFYFFEEGNEKLISRGANLEKGDDYLNYAVRSEDWEKGKNLWHAFAEACTYDMENTGDGTWTVSLDLPAGYYNYWYQVSYNNGTSYQKVIDPANRARLASMNLTERRSEIYVPFNAELHDPWLNVEFALPVENPEDAGARRHFTYAGVEGLVRPGMIYLPAGYDPDREEPYKVLYACHGGAGNEQDFFLQWHGDYITDRAIAEGILEPFIVVTMDNKSIGMSRWDVTYDNLMNYLIPYIEETYNVSKDPKDRAFCGLSMGGMTTCTFMCKDPTQFGYFGDFGGANCDAFPELDDYSAFNETSIYLGCGYCDHSYFGPQPSMGMVTLAQLLDDHNIGYNNGNGLKVVNSGHDWYTWDQLLRDFYETTLWK